MSLTDWLALGGTAITIYWTVHGLRFMKHTVVKVLMDNWIAVLIVAVAIWVSWLGVFRLILGDGNGSGKRLARMNELFKQDKLSLKRQR